MANTALRPRTLIDLLDLRGLTPAPSQVWGTVRLVPLIRPVPADGALRLKLRSYDPRAAWTDVKLNDKTSYGSTYVPHAMIVDWTPDGSPVAAWRTGVETDDARAPGQRERKVAPGCTVRELHRMIRREDSNRLRFLPMHLALEGLMALHFGGPDTSWGEWSREAIRDGLSPVWERSLAGESIPELGEALNLFELHPGQCGALIFIADALASAFVAPHPQDYRLMHAALIKDLYAEIFWDYAALGYDVQPFAVELGDAPIADLAALRARFELARQRWADWELSMGEDLIGRVATRRRQYDIGPGPRYTLETFITDLSTNMSEHVGEGIWGEDGTLHYLKTMRLSRQQVVRARLLNLLAEHGWSLDAVSRATKRDVVHIRADIVRVGLGHLLRRHLR
jgi:hypothetical protein